MKVLSRELHEKFIKNLLTGLNGWRQALLVMKITVGLIIVLSLKLSAATVAQTISMSEKKAPLKDILKEINRQTGYEIISDSKTLALANPVSIDVKDASLEEVLSICFYKQPLTYVISEKTIVVKPLQTKEKAVLPTAKETVWFEVTGTVTSKTGEVMPGVNVLEKGTANGTSTNAEGKYSLNVADDVVLVFSFIGYKTFEASINNRSVMDVVLEEDVATLKEVVINAGYYNVKDAERTGSIERVTSSVIEKQPIANPLAALQGRMPGVYVQQTTGIPGGDFRIQIRGRNSLRADGNEPLYIVDGVPFSTEKTFSGEGSTAVFSSASSTSSAASPLAVINPSDIESIEVLKDADATAIYGSRGANGVVLITTKKGKAGKTTFDLNVYTGVGKAPLMKVLNTQQYRAFLREAFANDGYIPTANPSDNGSDGSNRRYSAELMVWDSTRYTDWQKVLMGGSAQTTSVQASVSGGSENTQVFFSLGYRGENSVYPEDLGYQQGSFHLAANHRSANKKFLLNASVRGSRDKNNQVNYQMVSISRKLAPNAPALYDENGEINWVGWRGYGFRNPLGELQNRYDARVTSFTGNTIVGYEVLPGLQIKTSLGVNYFQSGETTKYPFTKSRDPVFGFTSANSVVTAASGTNQSWIIEPQADYERKIANGKLTLLIGGTFQEQRFERKADNYEGFPSDALLDNVASAAATYNYELVQSLYRYAAVFGRLNYNWNQKYIVNLTARRDGSSRFGPGRQFATFGAVGAAWIYSEEPFVKNNLNFLSFGKLRITYGTTGSDQIGNYQYLDTYATNASSTVGSQYQGVTWLSPTRLFNPDYAWEVNKKFEAAIETAFLSDRLSFTVSYFNNHSSNQLVNYTLPQTTGFSGISANLPATVQNTGWEVVLASENFRSTRSIQWATSVNITVPRNELVEFPNLESSTYANTYVVGKPLSIAKVLHATGVDPETGYWTFRDVNGDGDINWPGDDATKVMFVGQQFYGGLNNSLSYKGFTLDFLFQFVKQTGYNFWWTSIDVPGIGLNSPDFFLRKKIWRQPGDDAEIQRLVTLNNAEGMAALYNHQRTDEAIGDASFIRLKNVSMSYSFPEKFIKGVTCRLYVQGQNLLTFTNYEGGDPENQGQYMPPLKMFTVGVQFTL